MQTALRETNALVRGWLLLLSALALTAPPAVRGRGGDVRRSARRGQYRSLRLRNLPKDAVLAVAIQATETRSASIVSEGVERTWKHERPLTIAAIRNPKTRCSSGRWTDVCRSP